MSPPLVEWRDLPWASLWKDKCRRVAQAVGITDHLKPGRVESGCRLITGVVCLSAPRDLGASGGKWDVAVALCGCGERELLACGSRLPPDSSLLGQHSTRFWNPFQTALPTAPVRPQIHTISTASQASLENFVSIA